MKNIYMKFSGISLASFLSLFLLTANVAVAQPDAIHPEQGHRLMQKAKDFDSSSHKKPDGKAWEKREGKIEKQDSMRHERTDRGKPKNFEEKHKKYDTDKNMENIKKHGDGKRHEQR